jgi:hypothetical protein
LNASRKSLLNAEILKDLLLSMPYQSRVWILVQLSRKSRKNQVQAIVTVNAQVTMPRAINRRVKTDVTLGQAALQAANQALDVDKLNRLHKQKE